MEFSFEWDKMFRTRQQQKFDEAQDYIDEQCVEKMSEFVPVALPIYEHAGYLQESVEIEEPGKIIYTGFNAKRQYYGDYSHLNSGNTQATRLWFETMKSRYCQKIKHGVQKILGRK